MILAALVLCGADYVTGSNLPSHADAQLSCFTGHRIQVWLCAWCTCDDVDVMPHSCLPLFLFRAQCLCWRMVNQQSPSMMRSCGLKLIPSPRWEQESASTHFNTPTPPHTYTHTKSLQKTKRMKCSGGVLWPLCFIVY